MSDSVKIVFGNKFTSSQLLKVPKMNVQLILMLRAETGL